LHNHARPLDTTFKSVKVDQCYGQTRVKPSQIGFWSKHEYRP
jgi:pyridoxine/pyridoxamine 5'-phosphate oxidase